MTKESVALGVSGVLFGFLAGWIIGAQQGRPASAPVAAAAQTAAAAPAGGATGGQAQAQEAPKFDQARVDQLRQRAADNPKDARVRAALGHASLPAQRHHDDDPTD